ncbi:MAG: bifunctional alpha/beta hydrolase/class I SAM-dependent methyltransferase [Prosthecobacter sp.]|jgi:alpha-beta hydrolase superfamily lysophospholipase|uniref:bifunctional alpha/beta hydrolase/class I SAM-dependent methyltransferase n=1 Tax=Prosthecobacter sp. TaxID=1965333 RepID=UPI0019F74DC6|nr:bifunctional alpha/beta hydrolase/class I SAM-dependent methyltransferase [Prosthecobacter sp.]MBE2287388.1 bifunctional alpha/beta hydrolase/class I SAM-dependent methyltransferase [Prosthecobacter sp.]
MNSERLQFTTDDGLALHYKTWNVQGASKALVLLHRGHEHADRWDTVVPSLAMPDTAIYAWEARGHGQSPGRRGHAAGFMEYVRDLDTFFHHLQKTHGLVPERTVVVAHSVGAVIAATWVHDFAPRIAGLVLATPALEVNLIIPGALTSIRAMQKLKSDATIKSYVRGSWLTRDLSAAAAYDADKTISKDISAKILVDLFDSAHRVISDAEVMDRPLLLFSAGADKVVKKHAIDALYTNYGCEQKTHLTLKGARHAIFHDLCRDEVCGAIKRFAERCIANFTPPRLEADLSHPSTNAEFADLKKPLPSPSLKGLSFILQRASLGTLGRLSQGIRIGHATGFDSGESLDYVYENQARGNLLLGKVIDYFYINAIGWRGIRQRRACMNQALRWALKQARESGMPLQLMDIAGGAGRYLLDVLDEPDLKTLCRDWSESALARGRESAQQMGLTDRITHVRGDAFDESSLASVEPKPSIAVVSGLYELFPDNERLQRSLRGLFSAVNPGGWLIYTGQPWHPQVEMIARTLTNRDGQYWVMRRRPQGEMDALVEQAGFKKEKQWIDDFGIFTVSIARKPA